MNWARRLRWHVTVPAVATLAALATAALPTAAQAAGHPALGAGSRVPVFRSIAGLTAGAAAQALVPPLAGATPAVAATGDTTTPVLFAYTGADKHFYAAPLTAPASAVSFGGILVGGPGLAFVPAVGTNTAGTVAFARGGNNALYLFGGATSTGAPIWISLGGGLTSRPGAGAGALSVSGGEAIDAVVRGGDGAVWDREINATTGAVNPWRSLGGRVLAGSGPAAVNVGGTLYVLAVGTDGRVWVNQSTDGVHWSGWKSLGGNARGDLGVATPAPGVGVVFARAGSAVWYNEFAGTTAGVTPGWHGLGGSLTSGVGAGSTADGSTSVLVLGPNGRIYMRTGTWPALGNWTKLF